MIDAFTRDLLLMHRPGTHRVPVPGIIQDAAACLECGKAWPCPTAERVNNHLKERERHDHDL